MSAFGCHWGKSRKFSLQLYRESHQRNENRRRCCLIPRLNVVIQSRQQWCSNATTKMSMHQELVMGPVWCSSPPRLSPPPIPPTKYCTEGMGVLLVRVCTCALTSLEVKLSSPVKAVVDFRIFCFENCCQTLPIPALLLSLLLLMVMLLLVDCESPSSFANFLPLSLSCTPARSLPLSPSLPWLIEGQLDTSYCAHYYCASGTRMHQHPSLL